MVDVEKVSTTKLASSTAASLAAQADQTSATGSTGGGAPSAETPVLAIKNLQFGYGHAASDSRSALRASARKASTASTRKSPANSHPLVLNDVSLELYPGECLCLMGINGCGKSTLIDCVLGANKPCAGTIEVFGQDAAHLPQHKLAQYVSYVPQVHEKTFPYTVAHIVEMGATARSRGFAGPDDSAKEQALAALERCGIADLAERPYTTLSGGQMQMALLARALVQASPIILMDEPTAHLDFANELVFLETLTELAAERGMSILMATHSPNHAFHLARSGVGTRVALMSGGKIVEVGAPRTTLTPQNLERIYGIRACVLEGWELTDLDTQGGEGAEGTAGADGGEVRTTFAASDAASGAPATTDAASGARSVLHEDRTRPIIRQIVPLSTIKEKR